jgi:hypothetical protein
MTQRGGMVMSVGGEAAPGRRGGTNWANMNLTMLKNEKNYAVDPITTNEW